MYRVDETECDPYFLMYSMMGPIVQAELKSLGSGSTVEHLRVPDCEKITIPTPPLPIQQEIGFILRSIDDLIENNRRRVELLEEMAWAIYREWFVKFRYPGHEDVPLVSTALGPIPAGWEVCSVAELAEVVTRGVSPKYAADGPWIVLNQKCIRDQRVSFGPSRKQERAVVDAKRVRCGDVLINSTGVGTLGRVALYRSASEGVTVDSHVTIVRPSAATLNPWYGLTLASKQPEFVRLGTGSTGQTELRRDDIGALPLARPPDDLCTKFTSAVWPILTQSDGLLASSDSLAMLRDLLLPKLVTGRIDVSKLDFSALLEGPVA